MDQCAGAPVPVGMAVYHSPRRVAGRSPQGQQRNREGAGASAAKEYGIESDACEIDEFRVQRQTETGPHSGHPAKDGKSGKNGGDQSCALKTTRTKTDCQRLTRLE